jgi:hypothetical protein
MYNSGVLSGGIGAGGVLAGGGAAAAGGELGALPFSGLGLVWFVVAAFALVMAATALWRIVPRTQA